VSIKGLLTQNAVFPNAIIICSRNKRTNRKICNREARCAIPRSEGNLCGHEHDTATNSIRTKHNLQRFRTRTGAHFLSQVSSWRRCTETLSRSLTRDNRDTFLTEIAPTSELYRSCEESSTFRSNEASQRDSSSGR